MRRTRRMIAIASAAGLVAGLGLMAVASPAQAQPSLTVEGNENLVGGETITATISGFSPSISVAIGICPSGQPLEGAGDCGPAAQGYASLGVTDDQGNATAELQVPPPGPLGNTAGEPAECPPCSVSAAAIGGEDETAEVELNYADAGGATDDTDDTAGATDDAADGAADSGTAAGGDGAIAETGPRETLLVGIAALIALQIGLLLTVRSVRAGRR